MDESVCIFGNTATTIWLEVSFSKFSSVWLSCAAVLAAVTPA